MTQMTLTRDLWQAAERQVDKIKPQQIRIVFNEKKQLTKSMQSIFKQAQGSLSTYVPKAAVRALTQPSNVPQSVKLLDLYAQKLGYLPMGKIYQKRGTRYIGRTQQLLQNGQKYYKSFPKIDSNFMDSPNLVQNFSFRAGRAIQKWNQFTAAQSQLAQFIQAMRTQKSKKQLILQYAKGSTKASNYYKILVSLYFIYIQKKSNVLNPLQLSQQDIAKLNQVLTKKQTILKSYMEIYNLLQNAKQKNKILVDRIINYDDFKRASLKASLSQDQYDQIQQLILKEFDLAYIPPQLMGFPQTKDTQWFQVIKQSSHSIQGDFLVQYWDPKIKWFKTANYLT